MIDDNFGAREIGTIFNLAMMTQVDEIYKDRHMQMVFVEFLEALGRVAERVVYEDNIDNNNSNDTNSSLDSISQ